MVELVLVRHGERTGQAEDRYAGSTDVPLSSRGREQAEQLATWAASAGLSAIWSSPLSRTRETAAPSERSTGLTVRIDSRLRELDFGRGEGLTVAELKRAFPEDFAAFQSDPVVHHLPGGEDPNYAARRAIDCFKEIEIKHPGGRVLVVTHSTLIRLALCELIAVPLSRYRSVFPAMSSVALTEIRLESERASLLRFNAPLNLLENSRKKAAELGSSFEVKS